MRLCYQRTTGKITKTTTEKGVKEKEYRNSMQGESRVDVEARQVGRCL